MKVQSIDLGYSKSLEEGELVVKKNCDKVLGLYQVKSINHLTGYVVLKNHRNDLIESVTFNDLKETEGNLKYEKLLSTTTLVEEKDTSTMKSAKDLSMDFEVEKSDSSFTVKIFADNNLIHTVSMCIDEDYLETLEVECMMEEGVSTKYYDIIVTWGSDTGCVWEGFSILMDISPEGKLLDVDETYIHHAEHIEERRYCAESDTAYMFTGGM